jgi:hypothetical protein
MSTYSSLKIELIGTGEQPGDWGFTTNVNLGTAIEEAITGSVDVTFADAPVVLTLTDTNGTQAARNLRLNLIGTAATAQDLQVPAIEKQYIVRNNTASTITIKNATGTGVAVPAGKSMTVFNTGTNVVLVNTHIQDASIDNSPIGVITPAAAAFTTAVVSDDLFFLTTSNRIYGNFSSATVSERVSFQSSALNTGTYVSALPNGTATETGFAAVNNSNPTNASYTAVATTSALSVIQASRTGTGTYLPLMLEVNNAERLRINTAGAISIGTSGTNFGTNNQFLISRGDALSPTWQSLIVSIPLIIDGDGFVATTGVKAYIQIPFPCTITGWSMLADVATSAVIDVWKDTYANYPPTVADTITGSAKPTLTAANKAQSSVLTGWTTSIAAGDVLAFNLSSNTAATRITLSLTAVRV